MHEKYLVVYNTYNVVYISRESSIIDAIDKAVRHGNAVIYSNGNKLCEVGRES